ncbi:MAG: SIS domain-containing protein [Candidatus Marinimicrobia bacterium]|jgi:arabinose-5-phosphate isomerase|nr:SIS domain-containing protein [Candidatus Neomarinimicrobiota bacterium]MBT3937249.1 SIS domain-containing protein [Candidatus Neomarinimicrobiota bacterium]MBT3961488.1 SIS domain-containing protein [Candidatus Neomarinimicrobiota bacterium]MBT4382265.1 SIS domain-containing protein [Candidatus Neomarinimicrobiota bacterium]MBT4635686.1 SIS domain-containing protein [Candidatus Neomarinimicrobiota bacterium]|tara:strand:+ start:407 stop:997 length:591 start_codon:yes stop_codon:yes gene_type:complete
MSYSIIAKSLLEKEIESLTTLMDNLEHSFDDACQMISDCKGKIIFTGLGKSGLVAKKCAATFSSLGIPSFFIHSTEALHGDLGMVSNDDILFAFSYSGETNEVVHMMSALSQRNIPLIAMTGNMDSAMSQKCTIHLDIHVSEEADHLKCAPTSSTTNMMALGDAISSAVSYNNQFTKNDFHQYHPGGNLGEHLEKQ